MLNQTDAILADGMPDVSKLSQLMLSLQEKLKTIQLIDGEILDLTKEVATEIEQADSFTEGIYASD